MSLDMVDSQSVRSEVGVELSTCSEGSIATHRLIIVVCASLKQSCRLDVGEMRNGLHSH
jgi:hypothetical protein